MKQRVRSERRLRVHELDGPGPGWPEDGGGLRLRVETTGARRWVQRLTINGKRVNRGLGGYPLVTLQMARDKSIDLRRAAREGRDARVKQVTFREAFEKHWAQRKQGLKNAQYALQWERAMRAHVFPKIGERPVAEVTHDEIVAILATMWRKTPGSAKRLLLHMSKIFDITVSRGIREKAKPMHRRRR
jgi:hypothetical protein